MHINTLQLTCPTCSDEIEVEYHNELHDTYLPNVISLRTYCFCPITKEQAYELLMDYGARQAELATERAGERP